MNNAISIHIYIYINKQIPIYIYIYIHIDTDQTRQTLVILRHLPAQLPVKMSACMIWAVKHDSVIDTNSAWMAHKQMFECPCGGR